jgi:hypothetical protein
VGEPQKITLLYDKSGFEVGAQTVAAANNELPY